MQLSYGTRLVAKQERGLEITPGDDFTRAVKIDPIQGRDAWRGEFRFRSDAPRGCWLPVVNDNNLIIRYTTPDYAIAAAAHVREVRVKRIS